MFYTILQFYFEFKEYSIDEFSYFSFLSIYYLLNYDSILSNVTSSANTQIFLLNEILWSSSSLFAVYLPVENFRTK